MGHDAFLYLYDEQNEKVGVGYPQKLLKKVEREEREDIVFGCYNHIVLRKGGREGGRE